jgi:hypothetical protein
VIEIPCAFLALARLTIVRRFSVVLQALLQISIILTGNYTFFNMLTLFLMIPVWERDFTATAEAADRSLKEPPYLLSTSLRSLTLPTLMFLTAAMSAYVVKIDVDPSFEWSHLNALSASHFDDGVKIDVSERLHTVMKHYLPFSGLFAAGNIILFGY